MRSVLVILALVATAAGDAKQPVVVTAKAIVLRDPVYFEAGKAAIKPESYALLDAVAAAITADKRIGLVEIQGHTDERGSDAFNLEMSQKRADAIHDYLVGKGIDRKRLRAKGYGETQPLDRRHTPAAWEKNRRMAFVILQRVTT